MAAGHCDIETGLTWEEMENLKWELKSWSKVFLSGEENDNEIPTYSIFFRALSSDLEGRRGMFPGDFIRICNRIANSDDALRGIASNFVSDVADKFLPKWFAQKVREIMIKKAII